MGTVWAATHLVTQKGVALKFLKSRTSDQTTVRRFLREARAASAVKHPSVVQIHDVLEHAGQPVMVMDLLSGETLAARLARDRSLQLPEFARIMVPIVSAIGSAHAVGIVHRDLKPENVFLHAVADGEVHARVLDFGIAKLSAPEGAAAATAHLTSTGAVMGTPYYMAPEQVFGEKDLDHRADVWAVGVMSYECLAGKKPFDGDNVGQLFKAIVTGTFVPLENVAPHLPKDVTDAIGRLLELDRNERAPDLRELYEILKRYSSVDAASFGSARAIPLATPIESGALSPLTPPSTVSKTFAITSLPLEKRRWVPIGAVIALMAVGTLAWILASRQQPEVELGQESAPNASVEPEASPAPGPSAAAVEPAPVTALDAAPAVPKAVHRPAPPHVGTRPSAPPSAATEPAPGPPQPTRVPGTPVEEVPF